jgi:sugar transferase (PEP-CTERM system associated)
MPYIFNKYYPVRNIVFIIGEALLVFSSLLFINWVYKGSAGFSSDLTAIVQQALLVTVTFQLCLYFFDVYELRNDRPIIEIAVRITQAFGAGCIVLAAFYYFLPTIVISFKIFWSGYFIIYVLILAWRSCYKYILKHRLFVQSLVIVGTGRFAADIAREVEGRHDSPYRTLAFIGADTPAYNPRGVQVFPEWSDLKWLALNHHIDRIVVALDDPRGATPIDLLLNFKLQGIIVEQGVTFYERLTGKILVEKLRPSWIIFSDGFTVGRIQSFMKRGFDIIVSLVLLALSLPVLGIAALIIRLESPGPILYIQERVGKGRKRFRIMKFRSMVQDAEKNGAVWAVTNDSRVTRFGNFIRKTRIDELPQLFNVLKGEMSMVGPRPERPVFIEKLKETIPFYDIRHDVRPGVTGWAQVCYPYGASEEDALRKLEYDLYYMKNISLALDTLVILKTIKTVLFAKGSR